MDASQFILSQLGQSLTTICIIVGFIISADVLRTVGGLIIRKLLPSPIGDEIAEVWHSAVGAAYMLLGLSLTLMIAIGTEEESKAAFVVSLHIAIALTILSLRTDTDD